MNIIRTSQLTGVTRTLDIPITEQDLEDLSNPTRPCIQHLLPNLTPDEREFLLTGITAPEWANAFAQIGQDCVSQSPVQTSNTTTSNEQAV